MAACQCATVKSREWTCMRRACRRRRSLTGCLRNTRNGPGGSQVWGKCFLTLTREKAVPTKVRCASLPCQPHVTQGDVVVRIDQRAVRRASAIAKGYPEAGGQKPWPCPKLLWHEKGHLPGDKRLGCGGRQGNTCQCRAVEFGQNAASPLRRRAFWRQHPTTVHCPQQSNHPAPSPPPAHARPIPNRY